MRGNVGFYRDMFISNDLFWSPLPHRLLFPSSIVELYLLEAIAFAYLLELRPDSPKGLTGMIFDDVDATIFLLSVSSKSRTR